MQKTDVFEVKQINKMAETIFILPMSKISHSKFVVAYWWQSVYKWSK